MSPGTIVRLVVPITPCWDVALIVTVPSCRALTLVLAWGPLAGTLATVGSEVVHVNDMLGICTFATSYAAAVTSCAVPNCGLLAVGVTVMWSTCGCSVPV